MNLLYEEGGDIKIATVQSASGSGDAESWQATSLSGKKIKLKAKEVWLRFEKPEAQAAIDEAGTLTADIDLQLLWDCAPDEEFGLVDVAHEYFGSQASIPQQVALAIALQGAPVFFRRKGRGRFQRAQLEQLQAGLADSLEKGFLPLIGALDRKSSIGLQIRKQLLDLASDVRELQMRQTGGK